MIVEGRALTREAKMKRGKEGSKYSLGTESTRRERLPRDAEKGKYHPVLTPLTNLQQPISTQCLYAMHHAATNKRAKRAPQILIINKDLQVYFNLFKIQFLLLEALPVKHCD
jgi:hypothetical protein